LGPAIANILNEMLADNKISKNDLSA
jgi:DNA-binding Xre family transcriptional regulator